MNTDQHSFTSPKNSSPVEINLDEFMISEESFKPMTKGLGFHHDQKRPAFKATPKETTKVFGQVTAKQIAAPLSATTTKTATAHVPSGLEAFYGATPTPVKTEIEIPGETQREIKAVKSNYSAASMITQFFAWIIDVLVIASFVAITGVLLVLASGIELQMYSKLISMQDLAAFTAAIFSIYYLLYFTILDLSGTPGKTIFGLKMIKADNQNLSVKNTFTRALVSLLSGIALFLPMLLDFQGRLSDTKVVK